MATEWSLLKTHAGALDQPVRRDFPPPLPDMNAADVQGVLGVLLLATKDDTVIYGYGWNRLVALHSNVETIRLNKGDMFLFRGDFIYSPAGYLTSNLFVHGFLDSPFYPRNIGINEPLLVAVIDDQSIFDDLFCFVHNCDFVATGAMSLRRHLNRCCSFVFGGP
ncbi:hypothetical protein V7S43_007090 [Phytophthora oleae]|uniref:Cyclic nucleotide-binding domain-containing protein n=1 Tax=Phytophthora oleae TaxID=2107226 RepID=A0ABD3FP40_9STRA